MDGIYSPERVFPVYACYSDRIAATDDFMEMYDNAPLKRCKTEGQIGQN